VDGGWRGDETGAEKRRREAVGAASQRRPLSRVVDAVRTRSVRGSDRAVDRWALAVLIFFLNYPNRFNFEIKNGCITYSKNSQILHAARLGHYEQPFQLC
jgi:hypothetical protein